MTSPFIQKSVLYVLVSFSVFLIGIFLIQFLESLTYKVVLIFISLIILSNCFAKLFAIVIFKQDI